MHIRFLFFVIAVTGLAIPFAVAGDPNKDDIKRFEGIWKLSQNKSAEVAANAASALEDRPDQGSRDIAAFMRPLP